jgi:23S rRNA pseudoU1915 N3-methylase RlmH
MGNFQSVKKINFEDIQFVIKNKKQFVMINILNNEDQELLILNTLDCKKEEETINHYLKKNKNIKIVIYGKNGYEEKLISKYNQLINLGFKNVFIYLGGLFEWVLLQEVYGYEQFPTTIKQKCVDILKYKPEQFLLDID